MNDLDALNLGEPLATEVIGRLVRDLGTLDIPSTYGTLKGLKGIDLYKYFLEMTKPMERQVNEGATAALYLTVRLINRIHRRPDHDPVPF